MEEKSSAARIQRTVALGVCFVSAGFFYYWLSWIAQNTGFVNYGITPPVDHGYGLTWWATALLLPNGLTPTCLMIALMAPDSLLRLDFHLLITAASTICNVCALLLQVFIWLLWSNTLISGASAGANSDFYCCVYSISVPDQCASLFPGTCPPFITGDTLYISEAWKWHLIYSCIFLGLSFLVHWPVNHDIRTSGLATSADKRDARLFAVAFLFASAGIFYAFIVICTSLDFKNFYPLFNVFPSPGPFVSTLYGVQWWIVYSLFANYFPIILLIIALSAELPIVSALHIRASVVVALLNGLALLFFLLVLVFYTNDWLPLLSTYLSISNDDKLCCNFFSSEIYCPNSVACSTSVSLTPNAPFIQLIIVTLLLNLSSTFHLLFNSRFKEYNIIF